jgi:cyclohexadienyl dehydratase
VTWRSTTVTGLRDAGRSLAARGTGALAALLLAALAAVGPAALAAPTLAAPSAAGPVLDRVRSTQILRVCIWPEYDGVSFRNPRTGQLSGIDIDLSQALAGELRAKLECVDSPFATLVDDLREDRCDVTKCAVGLLPRRQQVLRFARPYLESDIYAVTTRSNRAVQRWEDIDRPGVRVAVQAGTFMELVRAQALKQATRVTVRPPARADVDRAQALSGRRAPRP